MLQLVIILGELIVLIVVICVAIYLLTKFKKQSVIQINIKNDTKHGVSEFPDYGPISEMPSITQINQSPLGFYSVVPDEEMIRSGGELIPQNISDAERDILRMFYNED